MIGYIIVSHQEQGEKVKDPENRNTSVCRDEEPCETSADYADIF